MIVTSMRAVLMFLVLCAPPLGFGQVQVHPHKGDGGSALKAEINAPGAVAIDAKGNIYLHEALGGAIRRVDGATGIITTLVEQCDPFWKEPRPPGCIGPVSELRVDSAGDLLFSEFTYNRLSRLNLRTHALSVVAGTGDLKSSGDGGPAINAGLTVSHCFTFDSGGDIIVCDSSHRIRRINAQTGIISTVGGSGRRGFSGDDGPALEAGFTTPLSVAADRAGNIYVADDTSNRIRMINASTNIIRTIAGIGPLTTGSLAVVEYRGEGGPATEARFTSPRSLVIDRDGTLVFALAGRVCRIDKNGALRTIVGIGRDGFGGDGCPAIRAQIGPSGLAFDDDGNLFIAEFENNRIRRVDAKSGIITTVAGNGLPHRPPSPIM